MGNAACKFEQETEKSFSPIRSKSPSPPILTPKIQNKLIRDPRSPSENIVRTPIESLDSPLSRTPTPEINTVHTKVLSVDPRSPTIEFIRTPIVVEERTSNKKLRNKNLDRARKEFAISSPKTTTPKRAPKLLESSPITVKPETYKRRSLIGLLETNVDYTETDLDAVLSGKEEKLVDVVEALNVDPRSPTNDFTRTPLQVLKKIGEIDLNDKTVNSNSDESIQEVAQSELSEIILPDILQTVDTPTTNIKEINTIPESRNVPLKEFNEKLSNLIYADVDSNIHMEVPTLKENKRTPLAVKNGNLCENGGIKKSANKLKVRDRPIKALKGCSKIPVYAEKKLKRNVQQCENTPPTDLKSVVSRSVGPRWDSDKTLII